MLRLVVADGHSVILEGLRALLSLEPDMEVAALCADGLEVLEAVTADPPDVLVLGANMPRCGALEAHQRLRERGLEVPTIILSATPDDETILRCLEQGVDGIVLKESAATGLVDAVRSVARGRRWIPVELAARAAQLMARPRAGGKERLRPRETDVMLEMAGG